MADREAQQKLYAYSEMSNKVQQAERSRRGRGEGTGEVETLRGRSDIGRMGDRISKSEVDKRPAELEEMMERAKKKKQKREPTTGKKDNILLSSGGQSILDLGELNRYQPTHAGSRSAYENLLNMIKSKAYLGNQSSSILTDAATEIIATLKDQNLRDPDRHDTISRILTGKGTSAPNSLSKEQFSVLVSIGKGLDDYEDYTKGKTEGKGDDELDDEMGVAVVFDSDEEADENNLNDDASERDEDEGVEVASTSSSELEDAEEDIQDEGNDDEEKIVIDETTAASKKKKHAYDRILSVHEIDAHYLQRQLSSYYDDANLCSQLANDVLQILDICSGDITDLRECENKLLVLLDSDLFNFIKLVLNNRVRIWACVSLKSAHNDAERDTIEATLKNDPSGEGQRVLDEINSRSKAEDWTRDRLKGIADSFGSKQLDEDQKDVSSAIDSIGIKSRNHDGEDMDLDKTDTEEAIELDLDSLAFRDGAHTVTNKQCELPEKSWRAMKKGYEEVHVPAVRSVISKNEKLVPISDLPVWTHDAFKGMEKLNRIQSKMCETALKSSENILLCAPTGAGKTNVAMLTMLNILGQYRKTDSNEEVSENKESMYDLNAFKIVYIAPMKALVQEVVKNFSKRLESYGVSVRELSGDSSLTRQQISETQILVTTPEKWDIVTRQGEGRAYTQLVRLVIIDEIHLLHDDRGPVLESIVSRIIRQVETNAEPVRLVGLSATLPNYEDVATFLRVKPEKGLFFFDHSYRPVPLQMQYIGITERNAFKRFQLQNEICYEKAVIQRKNGNQMLIFVHSRAETGKTAKALRDLALERDELSYFVKEGGATQEILREELGTVKNADLREVLQYGFATHHAGMGRADRELVEDLFADGHIGVLCCTATLAWGVNLPAHAVIIKGTQIYDPSKGRWAELSPLDVQQMLGRAGRPQYDSEGEGIIMTAHNELQYYLSLMNLQLPVESQMVKSLPDHLNAEIVLGNIQSISEAIDWLSYSFLYIRMIQNPSLYGIFEPEKTMREDPTLKRRRLDLAHTGACMLEKSHLIRYDRKSGALQPTPMGRISSQFYISHTSMALYSRHLRPNMTDIDLLRLFSLSGEFSHITVREEEKLELSKLAAKVPLPVKESPSEPPAKVNILLQAYISRLKLDGFALISDMAFIQQSAARIMRALFEIALRRNWSGLTKLTLSFANMVSHRIWYSQSPLRQFKNVPEVVARKLERKSDIEWPRYFDLTQSDLGELVGVPKMGRTLHKLVHQFPKLDLSIQVQPITRSMLRVELTIIPDFEFDISVHDYVQLFHVLVEDVNSTNLLHHEVFSLNKSTSEEEHTLLFTVPVLDPLPPLYFVRVISDRWLHAESTVPISFSQMILPPKFSPPTELLDLQPLPPTALGEQTLAKLYEFKEFNPVQTQTFHELFKTDRNTLICAPSGSGKLVCAEFAIHRMLVSDPDGKCVYVAPKDSIVNNVYLNWSERFGSILKPSQVVKLSGESATDLRLLAQAKIVVCSCEQWDSISRRWRQRRAVQQVTLFIMDDMHFLGGEGGPTMEVIISRMRYVSSQKQQEDRSSRLRIIGLSASLANAREVAEWMGVSNKSLFNFSPKVRPIPLEIYFQSFDQNNFSSRLLSMAKPVYNAVDRHFDDKPVLVFVPSRRQAQLTAIDLMSYRETLGESTFLPKGVRSEDLENRVSCIRDSTLRQVSLSGIGFVHEGMTESEWEVITRLYHDGLLRVLVCPVNLCWKLTECAHLVVIMGTEVFDGRERRYVDYPISDLLHMMGKASRQGIDSNGRCVILCHTPKKERLKRLLYDPLPIESHLDHYLHDHFNSEIVTKTIGSMQDAVDYITWTFLYRRLAKNPNYYNLMGTTNVHISEHLSEMIETILGDLEESKCCQMDEEGNVSPLNLGMIAAYYYVQYTTIELIASSVTAKTKTRGVMEILSAASEFSSLPIRHGEEKALKIIARDLKYQLPDSAQFHDSNTKTLVLLQCHFSRKTLSTDLRNDQKLIVGKSVNLIQAIVDVISSNGWLKPALAAMELSQMVVQGLWNRDNVLLQIPHFSKEIIDRCAAYEGEDAIESVFDILSLDDEVRNDLLRLPDEKMADVAVFCNSYPNVDLSFEVIDADDVTAGDPVEVLVTLERELDEEEEMDEEELSQLGLVSAPLYPKEKREGWWIVIGDTSTNSLLSLKRVNLQRSQKVKLEFMAPEEAGDYNLTIYCMSDSYLGCDQEYSVPLSVAVGESDSEESDEEE
jgi:pre-mRNA-splicing helicase BRR2